MKNLKNYYEYFWEEKELIEHIWIILEKSYPESSLITEISNLFYKMFSRKNIDPEYLFDQFDKVELIIRKLEQHCP